MITRYYSLWGDVFAAGGDLIGCAYDQGNEIIVDYYSFENDTEILHHSQRFEFEERVLFVRADMVGGHTLVMGQGSITGRFLIKWADNPIYNPNILTYGTHPCDLTPQGNYVVQVSPELYYDSEIENYREIPLVIRGTSNGIIQILPNGLSWADLTRQNVNEMLYPFLCEGVYVGEGRDDPPHIQALEREQQKNIFDGHGARPRAAYTLESNTFVVTARGLDSVIFKFYNRPLPNLDEPEIPVACTPVVPPQDVIATSCNNIRNFCQTYEFDGSRPYENDEIHDNGLFLADGITYFMMSDTGKWAQILMNPDDKRDWNTKRQAAETALFDYMKKRVGDFT